MHNSNHIRQIRNKYTHGTCRNFIPYRVFSRDILKGGNIGVRAGGRGVLGVYYLLESIIHHYYCQSEGREDSSQMEENSPLPPPLENTLRSSFHQTFEETKGFFFPGSDKN